MLSADRLRDRSGDGERGRSGEPQPKEECCENDGVLWDLVAIYPKAVRWEATMPSAVMFDGPVYRVVDAMKAALAE